VIRDPEDRWRLMRVSTDLSSLFGTRTDRGERLTFEWGEPDADGIYDAVFMADATDRIGELDEALAEAEAALPYKRWTLTLEGDWEDGWIAYATSGPAGGAGAVAVTTRGQGWGADRGGLPTPASALRALVTALGASEGDGS
jgi:hypothetical protein